MNGVLAQSHVMEEIKQEREVKRAMKLMEEFAVVNHQKPASATQMFVKVGEINNINFKFEDNK